MACIKPITDYLSKRTSFVANACMLRGMYFQKDNTNGGQLQTKIYFVLQ